MKEFERWWQYDAPNAPNAREGWKAALEWAKSQQEMDHGANGYVIDPEIIEEELEQ